MISKAELKRPIGESVNATKDFLAVVRFFRVSKKSAKFTPFEIRIATKASSSMSRSTDGKTKLAAPSRGSMQRISLNLKNVPILSQLSDDDIGKLQKVCVILFL